MALSSFVHKDPATPAENGCRVGVQNEQNINDEVKTRARPQPFPFVYFTNISGRQRQSLSDAGAPLTCSHSTLAKQNRARDKQQIGHISWPR